jgi:hypothetical protein
VQAEGFDGAVEDSRRFDQRDEGEHADEAGRDEEESQGLDPAEPDPEGIETGRGLSFLAYSFAGGADDTARARGRAGFRSGSSHISTTRVPPANANSRLHEYSRTRGSEVEPKPVTIVRRMVG